jgi:acyl carrier protein
MTNPETLNKLLSIINEETALNLTQSDINVEFEELDLDSLDITTIIMLVESEFDIEVPDEDFEKICTVNDLLTIIDSSN